MSLIRACSMGGCRPSPIPARCGSPAGLAPSPGWSATLRKSTASASRWTTPSGASNGSTRDRKSTRLNSSHVEISYDVFCLKKKKYYLAASLMNLGRYDEALAELDTAARMEQSQSLYRACKEELEKLIKAGNR